MSQIMVETFARSLLDKIMLEAFNIADTNVQDRKRWTVKYRADSGVEHLGEEWIEQQPATISQLPVREATFARYNDVQAPETIAKMLEDLRDTRIGDTSYVLPPNASSLERQVKHALHNIEVRTTGDSAEKEGTQGQGDVDKSAAESTLEVPEKETKDIVTNTDAEKENHVATEAQRISVSLLHRMIAELQTKGGKANAKKQNAAEKSELNTWEEREEIKRIANQPCSLENEEPRMSSSPIESPLASSSRNLPCLHEIDLKDNISPTPAQNQQQQLANDVVKMSSPQCGTTVIQTPLPALPDDIQEQSMKRKKQKKANVGTRLKKFFLSTFGRRKN